mmetsp:Transcript_29672/g.50075  ORF Transcript_29672/g.50075 Transcript_29672/m.50075 type:complete len:148 (+) Transcript_29672:135-578(+)|eukprot:CAMPEP_0114412348 /NCGR_PEP_ID=MMETSP0103-20121206/279_1 /TAXON_ID=37642 ORGANISM="Paraphysomonas imperforata, Strain PA2" /NCGR_SAMPLE_ID=MMETSP0103 /ASSEMBLY_ACC=CAM_ASM_000201 /LENGTH=147 /DNA_ID=CAMNT_0001580361 /DNA_START=125 /DNA_END=568 /DNA_ORIENTATION=-
MLHSVLITNEDGMVLFSKYFDLDSAKDVDGVQLFEKNLLHNTKPYWHRANYKQSVSFLDVIVLFQTHGDMRVFVTGKEETDELLLTDLVEVVFELLNQLEKVTEASLLVPDNFGKFSISLDEMIPDGILETMDLETIRRMIKLKHFG